MTSADSPARPLRALRALGSALWPAGTRRDTRNAVAALAAGALGAVVLGVPVLLWLAAVITFANWPVGGWGHVVLSAAGVVFLPVLILLFVPVLTGLQRSRLHATLGPDLDGPGEGGTGGGSSRS